MTWRAALVASLRGTLDHPGWWPLALAVFLIRGGLVLFLLPIVIIPTPAGLANAVAPTLVGFVFGSPSEAFVVLVALTAGAFVGWLLVGGLVAAWVEVALVRAVAAAGPLALTPIARPGLALRVLAARLLSLVPLLIAIGWGVQRVIDAAYAEIITPSDLAVPIVLRVVLRVPEVVALLFATWLVGETAGGLAVRHVVLGRAGLVRSLLRGWAELVVRPTRLATLLVTAAIAVLVAAPLLAASGYAWDRLRTAIAERADPILVALTLISFVAIWLAGLSLFAVGAAVRSVAWTLEVGRGFAGGGSAGD